MDDASNDARVLVLDSAQILGTLRVNSGAVLESKGNNAGILKPFGDVEIQLKDKTKTVSLDGDFKDSNIKFIKDGNLELGSQAKAKNIEAQANLTLKGDAASVAKLLEDIKVISPENLGSEIKLQLDEKVKEELNKNNATKDIVALHEALNKLAIELEPGDTKVSVTKNIKLQTSVDEIEVLWTSSHNAISTSGVVTRPTDGKDIMVILTATAKKGDKEFKRTFTLKVLATDATELNVVDEKESELVEHLVGTHYITVRLKEGFDYNNYTVTIKGSNEELQYDEDVKGYFYNNDKEKAPDTVVVVIQEKSTNKTQELTLTKTQKEALEVVDTEKSFIGEPLTGVYYVKLTLKAGVNHTEYSVKVKDGAELVYDGELGAFLYENSEGEVLEQVTIVVTEKATGRVQQVVVNKEGVLKLEVVDKETSYAARALAGVYYVKVELKEGFNYENYTVKVKGGSEISYDLVLKAFLYENSNGDVPEQVTIVVIEKSTGNIEEITLNLEK